MGPSTVAFLKGVYARAKAAGKFKMTQKPDMQYTWNTMVAGVVVLGHAPTDAEFQSRVIIREPP